MLRALRIVLSSLAVLVALFLGWQALSEPGWRAVVATGIDERLAHDWSRSWEVARWVLVLPALLGALLGLLTRLRFLPGLLILVAVASAFLLDVPVGTDSLGLRAIVGLGAIGLLLVGIGARSGRRTVATAMPAHPPEPSALHS